MNFRINLFLCTINFNISVYLHEKKLLVYKSQLLQTHKSLLIVTHSNIILLIIYYFSYFFDKFFCLIINI